MIPDRVAVARSGGFTLIELIVFIVVVAIVGTTLIHAFGSTMRGSHFGKQMTQATQLAQQRMEIIFGQRKTLGYATFIVSPNYDPCQSGAWPVPPSELCATTVTPAGSYQVSSTAPVVDACGTGCTEITVTVTGPYGDVLTRLADRVWNY